MPKSLKITYRLLSYLFLGIVIIAMVIYQNIILSTKGESDHKGKMTDAPT